MAERCLHCTQPSAADAIVPTVNWNHPRVDGAPGRVVTLVESAWFVRQWEVWSADAQASLVSTTQKYSCYLLRDNYNIYIGVHQQVKPHGCFRNDAKNDKNDAPFS